MATENGGHAPDKTWKEMYPTNYLKAEDVPAGKGLLITIRAIDTEKMRAAANKPESTEYVLRFDLVAGAARLDVKRNESGYGLVLNRTRCAEIDEIVGDGTGKPRAWLNKRIVLFTKEQTVQGKKQPVIHVRAPAPVEQKPTQQAATDEKMKTGAAIAPDPNAVIEKPKGEAIPA